MSLPTTSIHLSFIVFVIAHTLPCFASNVSTMSPEIVQSSTVPYQDADSFCRSPQYFEFGTRAVLNCSFPQVYFGIFWYNASELLNPTPLPLIYLKPSKKGGHGHASKEYDVNEEGSLIITSVNFRHDQNFSAIVFDSPTEYSTDYIHVIVTVRPRQTHPHIDGCNEDERVCFRSVHDMFKVSCTVVDARPNVQLKWFTLTAADYHPLISTKNVTVQNFLYTTRVDVSNIVIGSKKVVVYVCKSVGLPALLKYDLSMIVTKGALEIPANMLPITKYVQYSTTFYLTCTDKDVLYVVWRKQQPTGSFENVLDVLFLDNTSFPKSYSTDIHVTEGQGRSLLFSKAYIGNEGLYSCIFGDGIFEDVKNFNVQVYVLSDSPYPLIEGCSHPRHCALFIDREVTLTCVIKGVRPNASLEWEVVEASDKPFVTFFNHKHRVKRIGLKFEVSLTSDLRIQNDLKGPFDMKCTASNYHDDYQVESTITRFIPNEDQSINKLTTETQNTNQQNEHHHQVRSGMWAVSLLAIPLLAIILLGFYNCRKGRTTDLQDSDAGQPLNDMLNQEKKSQFTNHLQTTYRKRYEAIRPLPYDRGLMYNIDEIFVESSIDRFEKSEVEEQEEGLPDNTELWKTLQSQYEVVNSAYIRNAIVLLEGEAGYGKSTLGLKFAYDWCTPMSPLQDVDIFILLRMRNLKDISSIPAAVKELLLPKDSSLTVEDVTNILYNSASLVIFLDGFNRFPNQMDYENTVIHELVLQDVLSNAKVIITTRPSCLPKTYTANTKRFRMTGFCAETRNDYIAKVIRNVTVKEKIQKILDERPLLYDLCQVPLFFVLVVHILNAGWCIENSGSRSATQFFKILMKCFHSKMEDDACKDDKHTGLSQICFNAVIDNKRGIIWTKKEICKIISNALYNEYCNIGVLVEEQFRCHTRQRNSNNARYYTKVKFFHTIFCEWFAASRLSTLIAKSAKSEKLLDKINPFHYQYVFRFASGMNTEASGKIVKYLQSRKGCSKLAILCYVEQELSKYPADDLERMFSSPVSITAKDSLFLQRWTIELLVVAAKDRVIIECIWLQGMNISVDFEEGSCFKLNSGIVFPKLETLNQLSIREPGRVFTEMDIKGLLAYADSCTSLKSLRFRSCVMPFCLQMNDSESEQNVKGKKLVAVEWKHCNGGDWYRFNFQSGEWKCGNNVLTETEYGQILKQRLRRSSFIMDNAEAY